jgi:hypothetical protein
LPEILVLRSGLARNRKVLLSPVQKTRTDKFLYKAQPDCWIRQVPPLGFFQVS